MREQKSLEQPKSRAQILRQKDNDNDCFKFVLEQLKGYGISALKKHVQTSKLSNFFQGTKRSCCLLVLFYTIFQASVYKIFSFHNSTTCIVHSKKYQSYFFSFHYNTPRILCSNKLSTQKKITKLHQCYFALNRK